MANNLIELIPKDAEDLAAFIEAAKTLSGASKFAQSAVAKYFGPAIEKNWRRIIEKAQEFRGKIPPERHTDPSPSILIPLIDAASQESREELQDRWATLLANAMIDGGVRVRRGFVPTLSQFDPPDVLVLRAIINLPQPTGWNATSLSETNQDYVRRQLKELKLSRDEWEASCQNLQKLGCIEFVPNHTEAIIIHYRPYSTSFGKKLFEACTVV